MTEPKSPPGRTLQERAAVRGTKLAQPVRAVFPPLTEEEERAMAELEEIVAGRSRPRPPAHKP